MFTHVSPAVDWLHHDYETAVEPADLSEWCTWLAEWPTINRWVPIEEEGRISMAMKQLHDAGGSESFLAYLEERQSQVQHLSSKCINEVRSLLVDSSCGLQPLHMTVLPSLRDHAGDILPVVKLKRNKEGQWTFLEHFGVLTEISVTFFLEKLKEMKDLRQSGSRQHVALAHINEVYQELSKYPRDTSHIW